MVELEDIFRLLLASIAGALIGIEREVRDKPAGIRTNVLVCVGAAIFTILSMRIGSLSAPGPDGAGAVVSDPARIAAQIVTGIGFLGAGTILRAGHNIVGLTTAATIWSVASVGMAIGAGYYVLASAATAMIVLILLVFSLAERRIARVISTGRFRIRTKPIAGITERLDAAIARHGLSRRSLELQKLHDEFVFFVVLAGPADRVSSLERELVADTDIHALERD